MPVALTIAGAFIAEKPEKLTVGTAGVDAESSLDPHPIKITDAHNTINCFILDL